MGDEGLTGVFHASCIVLDPCHSPSDVQCTEIVRGSGIIVQVDSDIAHRHISIAVRALQPECKGVGSPVILTGKSLPHFGQAFLCRQ